MNYLSKTIIVSSIADLQSHKNEEGILFLSDKQEILDYCKKNALPAAGFEHDGVSGLKCDNILIDLDEVEDEVLENIYRRCKDIPWDIAKTQRTYIREFSMDDLDNLFELYNKPGLTDYMEPLFEYEKEKEYEKNYIDYIYKMYGFGMWLVFDKDTDELIGRAGIEARETCDGPAQVELGFCISPDRWREGLGFEVCKKIIDIAFFDYAMTSIIARCDEKNKASQKLLEKLGFTFEGYLKDNDRLYKKLSTVSSSTAI